LNLDSLKKKERGGGKNLKGKKGTKRGEKGKGGKIKGGEFFLMNAQFKEKEKRDVGGTREKEGKC